MEFSLIDGLWWPDARNDTCDMRFAREPNYAVWDLDHGKRE
jgi:hypothetical protein